MLRTSSKIYYASIAGALAFTYPFFNMARLSNYSELNKHPRMENRTAIVTGATGNLGLALSFGLARRKVRVIMACRDMEKCKSMRREIVMKSDSNNIVCRHLDLEDVNSIDRFVKEMEKTEPHIDILINCAGVKQVDEKEINKYGIEKHYFVNFLAPFLLSFRLMDKLKESANITRDSRIINVIGTPRKSWFKSLDIDDINFDKRKYKSVTAYEQSKLALSYFTILLDKYNRAEKNTVYVYATSPCFSSNRISASFFKPKDFWDQLVSSLKQWYEVQSDRVIQNAIKCALCPDYSDASHSGKLYTWFTYHWGWCGADKDENMAKRVWNRAAEMLLELPDSSKLESNKDTNDSSMPQIKNGDL